jgi:transposase
MRAMQSLPDLAQLSHEHKDELIRMLWPLVQQVQDLKTEVSTMQARIKELEGRLALNSRNSSKPPSSDGLGKPNPKSLRVPGQRPKGGQKGHSGNTLRQSQWVDQVIEHPGPGHCTACQQALSQFEVIERRQVFELPVLRPQVIEHRLLRARCTCGATHEGLWPEGINAPTQYGASVKALAVHLNQYHLLPLKRSSEVLRDIFGLSVSQASLLAFTAEAAHRLKPTVAAIAQAVQRAPIVHADETGIRVQDKLQWLHCAVTPTLTWLGHHDKRASTAFEALGVLPDFKGTLVHDGLAGYRNLDCRHSLCNAHHLRELTFVHEQERAFDPWAQEMIDLLLRAHGEIQQTEGQPLGPHRQAWFHSQWDVLLGTGETFNPPQIKPEGAPDGKRGRYKQSKAFNLLKRLRQYRTEVWRFMTDSGVPFTNNLAEQALRMSKVRQKISGCFRTDEGASTSFTIRSYLATMHKQGACLFDCLVSTFAGQPIQPKYAA